MVKIILIGVASLIGLVGCFGEKATPTPSPPEWLQPPKPPEVVLGTQELQVKYIGRIPVAFKNPEYIGAIGDLISVEPRGATVRRWTYLSPESCPSDAERCFCHIEVFFEAGNTTTLAHRLAIKVYYRDPVSGEPVGLTYDLRLEPGTERHSIGESYEYEEVPWCSNEFFTGNPNPTIEVIDVKILSIDGKTSPEQDIPEFIPGEVLAWEVSNPTANALAPYYVWRTRDQDGFLLSSWESGICASRHGSLTSLYGEMFLIPPGESIVVIEDLTEKEAAQNVTHELSVQTLEGCWFADYFGIRYDPNVRLISVEQSEEALTLVVENDGSGDGGGILYMNAYTQDGTPISGDLVGHVENIPAGEKVKRTLEFRLDLPDKVFDIALGEVRLEFVWLCLSK